MPLLALSLALVAAPLKGANAAPGPKQETRHAVTPGETLGGIAERAEVPRILIIEANALKPPYVVRQGQVLVIPRRRGHVVRRGQTGFGIAMDYGVPWPSIATANGLKPDTRVRTGQKLVIPTLAKAAPVPETSVPEAAAPRFGWPAPGRIRRGFAPRARTGAHDGIDLVGRKGDPAGAAAPGTVWYAGKEPNLYGNVVILDHGKGWFSAYAKLSKVSVKKGQQVAAGRQVGLIGNTGSTATTELHFEIRRDTVPQDPLRLLPARSDPVSGTPRTRSR
ncbi:MAG: M23 family metallopeptidase [Pseudomonadota bacterium]